MTPKEVHFQYEILYLVLDHGALPVCTPIYSPSVTFLFWHDQVDLLLSKFLFTFLDDVT
jgi:hypothetical protein